MHGPSLIAIAHRGASAYVPENTVAAFDHALELGCVHVELDVRLSADGVPVVIHDATLDRTTNGHGPVAAQPWLELRCLDAGSWMHPRFAGLRIASLDEALAAIWPRATPLLELKEPIAPAIIEPLLRKHGAMEDALIGSFDPNILLPFRRRFAGLHLAVHAQQWSGDLLATCRRLAASVVVLNVTAVNVDHVRAARQANLEVWVYTVNDVGLLAACAAMGVRGVITDQPDLVRRKRAI